VNQLKRKPEDAAVEGETYLVPEPCLVSGSAEPVVYRVKILAGGFVEISMLTRSGMAQARPERDIRDLKTTFSGTYNASTWAMAVGEWGR
jgi:hypothetical protein